MRIIHVDPQPFYEIAYRTAAPGGGILPSRLPMLRAAVDVLPEGCEALFACSDLQGIVEQNIDGIAQPRLLGEVVAEELAFLATTGDAPPLERVGVLLCGDLYVSPALDKRGGLGDVRSVWRAFTQHFRWVAGVAGNHDSFGSRDEQFAFQDEPGVYLLDGDVVDLDGLRVAGLGGIIGNKMKVGRRDERTFVRQLNRLLAQEPDVLLLHQGPDVPEMRLAGHEAVGKALRNAHPLTLCGHIHWRQPVVTPVRGPQIANLEGRGMLMMSRPVL